MARPIQNKGGRQRSLLLGFGQGFAAVVILGCVAPAVAQQTETPDATVSPDGAAATGNEASGGAENGDNLPEVIIETDSEPDKPAESSADRADIEPPPVAAQPPRPSSGQLAASPVPSGATAAAASDFDEVGEVQPQDNVKGALGTGPTGVDGYVATGTSTATKTNTPLQDIPQSISIVTKQQADDQGHQSLGQVLQYVPGVTVSQGEGHRDQVTIRGQSTTADFFTDGVRDDIQYYRDLYNIQAIEVLKGPAAMIFGRGGGGGVINRVTKKADWTNVREATITAGMYGRKRGTVDVGQAVTNDFAVRLNAMYEDSESFRDFFDLERYGINPTVGFRLSNKTTLALSYEYYKDERTVDRGVPSFNGAPFGGNSRSTFYGNPFVSVADFEAHVLTATLNHEFDNGVKLRNHTFYADYYKLYQNIMPVSEVDILGNFDIGGYQNITTRENFFNQTDVSYQFVQSSSIRHNLLAGMEYGVQDQFNFRNNPTFPIPGSNTINVANPVSSAPVLFDLVERRRHSDVETFSAYVQDQLEITDYFEVIAGIRYERFDIDFFESDDLIRTSRVDEVWSPRVGVVFKPFAALSLYASYSKSFLPSAGDQFDNLSLDSANLEPEEFVNRELGFKWEVAPRLWLTGALYQLDRENQAVSTGPFTATQAGLTETRGGEVTLTGYVTDNWQVSAGYARQNAKVKIGDIDEVGKTLPSVPEHTFSLWNRYQLSRMFGFGVGVIHQSEIFASLDNEVELEDFTRVDAALFFELNDTWSAQVNVENVFDEDYFASAHNNNNISPGAPRAAYVTVRAKF